MSVDEEQCLGKASALQRIEGSQQAQNSVCCLAYSRVGPVPGVTMAFTLSDVSELVAVTQECPYLQKGIRKGKSREEEESKMSFRERSKNHKMLACVLLL